MGMKVLTARDLPLVDQGFVPAGIAARWGDYALSSVHRAVEQGAIPGQRVGRRLYVEWAAFRSYVGPLAQQLPETAQGAVERWSC